MYSSLGFKAVLERLYDCSSSKDMIISLSLQICAFANPPQCVMFVMEAVLIIFDEEKVSLYCLFKCLFFKF